MVDSTQKPIKGTIGSGAAKFEILRTISYGGSSLVKLVRSVDGEEYAMKVLKLEPNEKAVGEMKIKREFKMSQKLKGGQIYTRNTPARILRSVLVQYCMEKMDCNE